MDKAIKLKIEQLRERLAFWRGAEEKYKEARPGWSRRCGMEADLLDRCLALELEKLKAIAALCKQL